MNEHRVLMWVVMLLGGLGVGTGRADANETVYQKALQATVWVINNQIQGSGVLVDTRHKQVVTNFHVVGTADKVLVCFPVRQDGRLIAERKHYQRDLKALGIPARVTTRDPRRDLAVLELESLPPGVAPLPLAGQPPTPGQRIHSVGNPGASQALWVYTLGAVRQVYRAKQPSSAGYLVDAVMIETQSPINPGDSGGPVLNDEGELLGLVRASDREARLFSYCIEVSEVKSLLQGEIKSIDRRVREQLEAAALKFRISTYGDFVLAFTARDGKQDDICVSVASAAEEWGTLAIRPIRAAVHVADQPLSGVLANRLLQLNNRCKLGAWTVTECDGKHTILFRTQVDGNCDGTTLCEAIKYTVTVVAAERPEIARLAGVGKIELASMVGVWKSRPETAGKPVAWTLHVQPDGTFTMERDYLAFRGTYDAADGVLRVTADGKSWLLASVQSASAESLVLRVKDARITLVRQPLASVAGAPATTPPSPLSTDGPGD